MRVIPGPDREFAGIVGAGLDPDHFKVLLRSVLYAPDMWTSLAHEDGKIFLFMPPNERMLGAELTIMQNRPTSGAVAVCGASIVGYRPHAISKRGLARTFQNIFCDETGGLPAYAIWIVSSDTIFPLSHKSPESFASAPAELAAIIWYAVCF